MKIGIVTQPLRMNYGGVMQNFALQQALKSLGHFPVTIDPIQLRFKKNFFWYARLIKRFVFMALGDKSIKCINPEELDRKSRDVHKSFIDSHISYISKEYPLKSTIIDEEAFEAFIVGSDQVWRPRYSIYLENCFLDFTSNKNVIRISYAASFGTSKWELNVSQTRMAQGYIKKFKAVSVRESDGVKLCEEYLNNSSLQVLDPTMLLSAEQYRKLYIEEECVDCQGDVFVYILDINGRKRSIIDDICNKMGKKAYYVKHSDFNDYTSIESWIAAFDKADFVITDSFHGIVFSIIFGKQFINITNNARGLSRISSLLEMFEIDKNRMIAEEAGLDYDFNKVIDYGKVHEILQRKREVSLNFLQEVLR